MKTTLLSIILTSIFFINCSKPSPEKGHGSGNPTTEKKEVKTPKNENFDFKVSVAAKDDENRPVQLKINIFKNNKGFQEIIYTPGTWPAVEDSLSLNRINYFLSGEKIKEGIENYHDFIIADFNFDQLEDFAILYDSGGNGGPVYSYYFQDKNDGTFKMDKEFPLNEGAFPKIIDSNNKTLTTIAPLGCCKINTTIFQLKENKWNILSSKEQDMKR